MPGCPWGAQQPTLKRCPLPHIGTLAGALVGPPWSQRELGVVLRENLPASAGARGASLYYEPHAGEGGSCREEGGSMQGLPMPA